MFPVDKIQFTTTERSRSSYTDSPDAIYGSLDERPIVSVMKEHVVQAKVTWSGETVITDEAMSKDVEQFAKDELTRTIWHELYGDVSEKMLELKREVQRLQYSNNAINSEAEFRMASLINEIEKLLACGK